MAEALAQVKRDFGNEAVILHTRSFTEGGVLGYRGRQIVEITASKAAFSLPRRSTPGNVTRKTEAESTVEGATKLVSTSDAPQKPTDSNPWVKLATLSGEIGALKSAVTELVSETRAVHDPTLPEKLREAHQRLIAAQVADDVAGQLVRRIRSQLTQHELHSPAVIRKQLASYVESMLPVADPVKLRANEKPSVIALVGPTGVGKTTTIAKLAAGYRLRQNRDVGLITIDTYRIAAVDQLQTYARIIDVPLEIVASADEMRAALNKMGRCDVILIDTAGHSPNDETRLTELSELVRSADPREVHLVLAANCGTGVLNQALDRYNRMGVNRLIFTKLDEAVGFGVVLNCLRRAEAKLSYITTGQEVPDDIQVGRGSRLADLIIDGSDRWPSERKRGAVGPAFQPVSHT
ncbi:MAG: flagellar biosynthesis protein FlhF [Phycisphaerae bacterium]